jgi:2-polyprenyl-3-methyl-5-hydroxy-6-metoxy-1,4-benzoquinol methylase
VTYVQRLTQHREQLQTFFAGFLTSENLSQLSQILALSVTEVEDGLQVYLNESAAALNMIAPYLSPGGRVLELGGGIPFLSVFLAHQGYQVVSVDSYEGPFAAFWQVAEQLRGMFPHQNICLLHRDVQSLQRSNLGEFSLIFSFNVLEHITNPEAALATLSDLMTEDGRMIHSCPNYRIPYEPHFGLFLPPGWPQLGRYLYASKISKRRDLWESLNFIHYRQVIRAAKHLHLHHQFERGTLAAHIDRLFNDPIFQQRHRLIHFMAYVVRRMGGMALIRKLPPPWNTPMTFSLSQKPGTPGATPHKSEPPPPTASSRTR